MSTHYETTDNTNAYPHPYDIWLRRLYAYLVFYATVKEKEEKEK